jgi:hypothetical protein
MAQWWNNLVSGLGQQNAPFGFAPGTDPYQAGMQQIGNIGAGMLANSTSNPLEAFGRGYLGSQEIAQQNSKEAFAAKQMMEQAEERRQERDKKAKLEGKWNQWATANADKFGEYADLAPYLDPNQGMQILSGMQPDLTDDMKEYRAAVEQGYNGGFMDYMSEIKRAGANNITIEGNKYGTIPPGYQLLEGKTGASMQPIPGSPADLEAEQAAAAKANKKNAQSATGDLMVEDIDRTLAAVTNSTLPTTGMTGSVLKNVPGTGAADVNKLLTGIRANIGFDRLQRMRDESPTGGALGQVAVQELESLQSVYGSLEQSQSREQFEYNLKRLKNMYLDIIHGPGSGPPREQLITGRNASPDAADDDGYIVEEVE